VVGACEWWLVSRGVLSFPAPPLVSKAAVAIIRGREKKNGGEPGQAGRDKRPVYPAARPLKQGRGGAGRRAPAAGGGAGRRYPAARPLTQRGGGAGRRYPAARPLTQRGGGDRELRPERDRHHAERERMRVNYDVEFFYGENEAALFGATLNEVAPEDLPRFQSALNDFLESAGVRVNEMRVEAFEFDGCEDVRILLRDGRTVDVCAETTFGEMLEMISEM